MLRRSLLVAALMVGCGSEDSPAPAVEDSATVADSATPDSAPDAASDSITEDSTIEETASDTAPADAADAPAEAAADSADTADTAITESAVDTAVADTAVVDTAVADTGAPETDAVAACVDLAAPTCNALAMPAAAAFVTTTIGTIPAFTRGGALPDGTYVLIKQIKPSGTPSTFKDVVTFFGGCVQDYSIKSDATEVRANAKIVNNPATGAQTFTFTCPTPFVLPAGSAYGVEPASGGKVKLITLDYTGTDYREWMQQ